MELQSSFYKFIFSSLFGMSGSCYMYRIYPKYSDTSTPYHSFPKNMNNNLPPDVVSKNCWISSKQCRPRRDAAERGVTSGSTLLAQACQSGYIW